MDKKSSAPSSTPLARDGTHKAKKLNGHPNKTDTSILGEGTNARSVFVGMALTMSWQLAVVVLFPIFAGVQLDKALSSGYTYTFIGLGVALLGSIVVMWSAIQRANRIPVPKLTEEQKRAIQKGYEEEDKEE